MRRQFSSLEGRTMAKIWPCTLRATNLINIRRTSRKLYTVSTMPETVDELVSVQLDARQSLAQVLAALQSFQNPTDPPSIFQHVSSYTMHVRRFWSNLLSITICVIYLVQSSTESGIEPTQGLKSSSTTLFRRIGPRVDGRVRVVGWGGCLKSADGQLPIITE